MKEVEIRLERVVRQVGVIRMQAKSAQEGIDCVQLMAREIAKGSAVDLKARWSVPSQPSLIVISGHEV